MATLYQRLEGAKGIDVVVDKFYQYMLNDPSIKEFFKNTDMQKQRKKMKQFISKATGGPPNYQGKDLRTIHKQYEISENDFNNTWRHLERAMKDHKIEEKLIDEAKKIFYSYHKDVVNLQKAKNNQDQKNEYQGQKKSTLFMRLGGEAAINCVVDRFYEFQLNDPITGPFFKGVDMKKLAKRQKQFLTMLTGGSNKLEGFDLKTAHSKHKIGKVEFQQFWKNMERALKQNSINYAEMNELKTLLFKLEDQIVQN